ncbi:MAG: hypothetical protein R3A44_03995 [Caldilineaceae bacterium]
MPARRERIYLSPDKNGQPGWIMDFPLWWNRADFFKQYGQRRIDTGNPIYVDYALLLTRGEALVWDQQCREAFAQDPRGQPPKIIEMMDQLEARLKSTRWVIVESYEWESGLD